MLLCFDKSEGGVASGRLWSSCCGEVRSFRGLERLMRGGDTTWPAAFFCWRRFNIWQGSLRKHDSAGAADPAVILAPVGEDNLWDTLPQSKPQYK